MLQLICTAYCYWQHTVIVVCVGEPFVAVDMHCILLLSAYCYCCVWGRPVCCSLYAQPTVTGSILLLLCVWESCLLQFICTAYCHWQHTVIVLCVGELFVAVTALCRTGILCLS